MPSNRLCVFGCETTGVTIHNFPNPKKFPERFQVWKSVAGEALHGLTDAEIYKRRKVCDRHFTDQDRNRNSRLNALATPISPNRQTKACPPQHADHTYIKDQSKLDLTDYVKRRDNYFAKARQSQSSTRADLDTVSADSLGEKHDDAAEGICITPPPPDDDAQQGDADTEEVQFSWQHSQQICVDDDADYIDEIPPLALDIETDNLTKVKTRSPRKDITETTIRTKDEVADNSSTKREASEYWCDSCSKEIIDFRYTCVQCENFDLCSSCEMRMVHPQHYMLRVPPRKPFAEVKSVLEAIKEKLNLLAAEAKENSTLLDLDVDEIKLEEPEFANVVDPFVDLPPPPSPPLPLARPPPLPATTTSKKNLAHVLPKVFRQDIGSVAVKEWKQKRILSGEEAQCTRKRKSTYDLQENENTRKKPVETPVTENRRGRKKHSLRIQEDITKPNVLQASDEIEVDHSGISKLKSSDVEKLREETKETQEKDGEEMSLEEEEYLDEMWLDDAIMECESNAISTDIQPETSITNSLQESSRKVSSKGEQPASVSVKKRRVIELVKVKEPLQSGENVYFVKKV